MMRTSVNSICLVVLASAAAVFALQQGEQLFAPVLSALLLGIVLTPLSNLWERLRLPDVAAAFLTVSLALAVIILLMLVIEPYVSEAIRHGPVIRAELRETIAELRRLLSGLEQISDEMASAIEPNTSSDETREPVTLPSLTDALFYAPAFLAQFLIFAGTLYFFLLSRNEIYDWLSANIDALGKADLRRAAQQVARYVLTISAINFTLGAIVAGVMQVVGMPSPMIWGLLAFLLNFVLYLGPIILISTLTVTGVVVFDGAMSFLPAALYVAINATEAQFVTPTLVGKSLAVNPLLVFLSLVFWLWLWGPIGGIIAIPLLIWTLTVTKGLTNHAISGGTPGRA